MERSGDPEETYFTFSYSLIRDEEGGVGGMFCACTATTGRVLAERRLQATAEALRASERALRESVTVCTLCSSTRPASWLSSKARSTGSPW
jgi:hypothetical protein